MFSRVLAILGLLLIFVPSVSVATVLFVQTNENTDQEVAAARRAAQERGEPFVVVGENGVERWQNGSRTHHQPYNHSQVEASLRPQLEQANARVNTVLQRFDRPGLNRDSEEYESLVTEYQDAVRARNRLEDVGAVRQDSLREALRLIQGEGGSVTSMVVSGHHVDRYYSGTNGGLSQDDISEVFGEAEFSGMGDTVLSLVLPACFSCRVGTASVEWGDAFPNRQVTFGYNPLAPLGYVEAGHDYIYNSLIGEAELLAMASEPDLSDDALADALLDLIPESLRRDRATICLGGGFVDDPELEEIYFEDGELRRHNMLEICPELLEAIEADRHILEGYLNGRAEDGDSSGRNYNMVPGNTSRSELRSYYGLINDFMNCPLLLDDNGESLFNVEDMPDVNVAIALIFFDKVRGNFASRYGEDLADSIADLRAMGVPDSIINLLEKIRRGTANRREVVDAVTGLENWYAANEDNLLSMYGEGHRANQHTAFHVARALRDHLVDLNPGCVPSEWYLESSAGNVSSRCDQRMRLGVEARGLVENNSRYTVLQGQVDQMTRTANEIRIEVGELETQIAANPTPELQTQLDIANYRLRAAEVSLSVRIVQSNTLGYELRHGEPAPEELQRRLQEAEALYFAQENLLMELQQSGTRGIDRSVQLEIAETLLVEPGGMPLDQRITQLRDSAQQRADGLASSRDRLQALIATRPGYYQFFQNAGLEVNVANARLIAQRNNFTEAQTSTLLELLGDPGPEARLNVVNQEIGQALQQINRVNALEARVATNAELYERYVQVLRTGQPAQATEVEVVTQEVIDQGQQTTTDVATVVQEDTRQTIVVNPMIARRCSDPNVLVKPAVCGQLEQADIDRALSGGGN